MEANNPYEPPRSSSSDDAGEPSPSNPLLAELTRGRPWALAAGVSIAVAGVAMLAVIVAGGAAGGTAVVPTLGFLCGCGLLSARLLILSRTLRQAATPPHRIDLCFRDIRKVFSHPGGVVAVFLGLFLLALLFMLGGLALLPGRN
jgi:hypothetical protein